MTSSSPVAAEYHIDAFNYATDSENRMHNDDTAPKYGFRGGLVPGIGVYGYMTRAMLESHGNDWLYRGQADVRFLKPVYDGERVSVTTAWNEDDGSVAHVSLKNPDGVLCGTATATIADSPEAPNVASYSKDTAPDEDARPDASLDALPAGSDLGAFEVGLELEAMETFAQEMRESFPLLAPASTPCHPAYYPSLANEILVRNVVLGPWIHAGSSVRHFDMPQPGSVLAVQGRVEEAFEKKGHEMVVLDVLISADQKPMASVRHTAIIRPRVAA